METFVYATVKIAGLHYWPEACEQSRSFKFLNNVHRHIFHIKVTMSVTHNNRQIEFLELQEKIVTSLKSLYTYHAIGQFFNFDDYSCEDIAKHLLSYMSAWEVEVSEDGENGAIVRC